MSKLFTGIHHITALAGDPQANINFYSGVLGLRFLKKTVNFDAPEVYHFYYGDEYGLPGSILTFFPYAGIVRGRRGKGMLNTVAFSASLSSKDFWEKRLSQFKIGYQPSRKRFEEWYISFEDHDGLGLELVFTDRDNRPGFTYGHIPLEFSIKGFYCAEIWEDFIERTAAVLTGLLDHDLVSEEGGRFRYAASNAPGHYVDIMAAPDSRKALPGGGTVHHIAFALPDETSQEEARKKLSLEGLNPTPIIDRQYFKSIYFREPGGVLFEAATAGPGFAVDEPIERLGESLKLPPQYESYRQRIEQAILPLEFNPENFK